ncbi:hypothetical protein [Actinacidiphila glaucinigra]|uniref:hypothetical protein n=1 Tax=Actinacidiphila glaucinigra TaxID=235986 RepID=UPI002E34B826|nr:hypothetical protein [Actinacidiphila glaucinigra]
MTDTVTQPQLDQALIEEAVKKSGLLWADGQALWHAWVDGALVVVGGGPGEQPLPAPGLTDGGTATVTVRSKDKGGRLVVFPVRVTELRPDGEAWTAAVEELKGKRLNAPDAATMTRRWARECRVLRLEPAGDLLERPGAMPDGRGAAAPLPTAAITRRPIPAGLPKLLLRRRKKA